MGALYSAIYRYTEGIQIHTVITFFTKLPLLEENEVIFAIFESLLMMNVKQGICEYQFLWWLI